MNRMTRSLSLALVGGLAVTAQVEAVPVDGADHTYCIVGGSGSSCASINVSVNGPVTVLTATFSPLINPPSTLAFDGTVFGFYYLTSLGSFDIDMNPATQSNWDEAGAGDLISSLPSGYTWLGGAGANPPNAANRLDQGESITVTFDIDGNVLPGEIFFAFRGQEWGLNPPGSFKCFETGETTTDGYECGPGENGDPPGEVIPEPATLSLLAIGLVGLGGAGMVRRRKEPS